MFNFIQGLVDSKYFSNYKQLFIFDFIQGLVTENFVLGLLTFAITTLLVMNNDTESKIFKLVKNTCCLAISGSFITLFYNSCIHIVGMEHYIIGNIIIGVITFILTDICLSEKDKTFNNLRRTLARVFMCIFLFTIAVLVFAFLYECIEFSYKVSANITVILYAIFAFPSSFIAD